MRTNAAQLLPFLLILLTVSGICGEAAERDMRFTPDPVSPRKIEVKSEGSLPIASEGKALCEVVIPAKSSSMLQYAGKQLAFYLKKIIGGEVTVRTEPSGNAAAFVLGTEGAKLAGFDLAGLDRDGYIIRTVGNRIVIAGNDDPSANPENPKSIPYMNERGTLNGVYEFLERFGGVRFYFPGEVGTVVPRRPDWQLPQIDIIDRPDETYRRVYYGREALGRKTVFYGGPTEKEIRMLSAFQTRQSTLFVPNCHGLAYLGLVQRFGKSHPEFFALRDNGQRIDGANPTNPHEVAGQLCFNNDGLKQVIYEDAKAFLTGQSAASRGVIMPNGKSYWEASRHRLPFFNIHPNDGLYPCRCPKCKPVFAAGYQASSNMIWKFKTDIAKKLKQEGIPGYLTMMAYGCYTDIPELDIPDNVIVQLAQAGPWNESNPAAQEKALAKLKAWKNKLGTKPYLWNYVVKTGNRGAALYVPSFTPKAVGSYFKKAAPDICGSFLQSDTDCWLFSFMNSYVFGKLMWNVSTDVEALMEEHFRLMYGPAAPEMKEFYDTMERHWMKDISGKIEDTPLGPVPVYPSYFKIWTEIYGPAEIERIGKLFDLAEKKASGDPEALKRVKFMRKEMWGQVLEGAEIFNRSANDRKLWTVYVPSAQEDKILIDGKLDEAAWKNAETVWLLPEKGKPAEVHTRVRLLADQDNFYVGIECDEPHTGKMVNAERGKDDIEMWRDNVTELFFSSGRDATFLYQIMLTSAGQVCDLRSENRRIDVRWESDLEYKHSVVPEKMWIAEVRIPRSSMPELAGNEFAVNFTRSRILTPECEVRNHYYSWFPRGYAGHTPENFGRAVFGIRPENKSVIRCGDFDGRVSGKRMYPDTRPAWHADAGFPADRQYFMTGGQSVRLERPEGSRVLRQFFDTNRLKAGMRYRLSFYLKLENVTNPENPREGFFMDLRFGKKGPDNVLFPLVPSLSGSQEWTRYQFEFTAPEGTGSDSHSTYIGFYLHKKAQGKVWIDHVELVPAE